MVDDSTTATTVGQSSSRRAHAQKTTPATRFLVRPAARASLYALQVARAKDRASDSAIGSPEPPVDGAQGEAVAANIDETAERKRRVSAAAHLVANRSAGLNKRLAQ